MAEKESSALRALGERLVDRVIEFGIHGGVPCTAPSRWPTSIFSLPVVTARRPFGG
jgi:hypothetical protein